jgi:putative ABC transport system ATP-binding protein
LRSDNNFIELRNIDKSYSNNKILSDLELDIHQSSFIGIFGESGSGKTTLISIIGLLDTTYTGNYRFFGRDVHTMNDESMSELRRNVVGFIFQNGGLINDLLVIDNIMINKSFDERYQLQDKLIELSKRFRINNLLDRKTNTLSGGEKQRVALACALLNDSKLIIADEPTGNLDHRNSKIILDFLKELSTEDKTVIVVTHDMNLLTYCDYAYNLENKQLRRVK